MLAGIGSSGLPGRTSRTSWDKMISSSLMQWESIVPNDHSPPSSKPKNTKALLLRTTCIQIVESGGCRHASGSENFSLFNGLSPTSLSSLSIFPVKRQTLSTMGTTPMAGNCMPSQAQLALAMAVVKHKPAGMGVQDYVLQIRMNIKNAKDCGSVYLENRFFDSVSFWQHAYERSEAEQSRLMDRIYELEQRNEVLLAKLQSQNLLSEENTHVLAKRKANGDLNARKRAKTQVNLHSQTPAMALETSKLVEQPEYMEESTASFMRHFYALQRAIQRRPSRSTIVQSSADLCEVAVHEVLTAVHSRGHTVRPSKKPVLHAKRPHLEQVLRSVRCAFQLILQALEKLPETENDHQGKGQLAYHLIRLYQAIATAFEQHCVSKSGEIAASTGSSNASKNMQARKSKGAKACQGLENLTTTPVDEVASQISRLLGSIAISLNLTYAVHRTIFEGLLYVLLARVGTLLCTFVFQDLQLRPDLRVDQTKLPLPQGLQGVKLDDRSLCAMQMEAKHLVWPLERSLALLDDCASAFSTLGPQDAPETMAWVAKMKQQLQGTLLQALFGSDRSVFPHTLQQPETLDTHELERLQNCTHIPEQSIPDWFTQEIWRLLGWDLLSTQNTS